MIPLLALLLWFAETPKGPATATSERFAKVSKQAAEAREQERLDEAVRFYREPMFDFQPRSLKQICGKGFDRIAGRSHTMRNKRYGERRPDAGDAV